MLQLTISVVIIFKRVLGKKEFILISIAIAILGNQLKLVASKIIYLLPVKKSSKKHGFVTFVVSEFIFSIKQDK